MRYRYLIYCVVLLSVTTQIMPRASEEMRVVRIGIVMDGYWELYGDYRALFQNEILELTRGEFDVRFPEEKRIQGDWTAASVKAALDKLLADPQVDLIFALGLIASHDVIERDKLSKPVLAPFVLDAELQGLPMQEGASRVFNFCYVNIPDLLVRDIRAFLEVVKFKKMAYLINTHYLAALPDIEHRVVELLSTLGIETQVIGVGDTFEEALAKFSPDVDAVYFGPLTSLPRREFRRMLTELKMRKLPSFSGFDVSDVELGALACSVSNMYTDIARRIALDIQRILLGEEPGSIPVNIDIREQLTINLATARAIDVYPDWSVLTEAELINVERINVERTIDLDSAVKEAVEANLDLAAKARFVAAGAQNVKEARSKLLPQLDLAAAGTLIDKARADASFGSMPQRALIASATVTQLIFSEPAWANYSVQKSIQESREWNYAELKLDIALAAAKAYLNVLRAKTFERIQRDNVRRTRANLEIALIKESTGTADPAEVYRWKSEIASNRIASIRANARRNLAEINLNRILHRPLEEPFITVEADLNDQVLYTSEQDFLKYTSNYRSFKVFRDFLVEEGLRVSPELAALDASTTAQERILLSAKNSYWMPTLAFQGQYSNILSKGGAGTGSNLDLPPPFQFPQRNDNSWSLGLSLSFPLFKSGEKSALRIKAVKELEQLQFQRESVVDSLEERIRAALHLTGASLISIEQAEKAAAAAEDSLEVVQNAYELGAASILRLLDAQNAAYSAQQVVADAVYSFLIDLMEMERSIGRFEFFMSSEERQAFIQRLGAFFERAGVNIDE